MKRILITLMSLAMLCACNDNVCKIDGTLTDPVDSVRLVDMTGNVLDVSAVKDGAFTLKCDINPEMGIGIIRGEGYDPISLIPDVDRMTVAMVDGIPVVTGSPMSQELQELQQWITATYMEHVNKFMNLMEAGDTTSAMAVDAELQQAMSSRLREVYMGHKADPIGQQAMGILINFITPEEFIELYEQGEKVIQEDAAIASYYELLKSMPQSGVITLLDNGEIVQEEGGFEDYVGKGKYTLVDFWASWCGPCRKETPNVVAVFEKYRDKGLVVIGIPVNDKKDAMEQALKDLGIHYPQVIDPLMKLADQYHVEGIPYIILFDPEGNIVAKDLRGAQIEDAVSKVL